MKKVFYVGILLLMGCSPKLTTIDIQSRNNADNIIKEQIDDFKYGFNHIIFSIAENDFIVIVEKPDCYEEYFCKKNRGNLKSITKKTVYNKPNDFFLRMFDKKKYKKEFITFNSKFFYPQYEISSGNITYFVFKDEKNKRFGEARLSFFIKPNPIDYEVYSYLTNKILEYNNINVGNVPN